MLLVDNWQAPEDYHFWEVLWNFLVLAMQVSEIMKSTKILSHSMLNCSNKCPFEAVFHIKMLSEPKLKILIG
jgi:hypothetical protein